MLKSLGRERFTDDYLLVVTRTVKNDNHIKFVSRNLIKYSWR